MIKDFTLAIKFYLFFYKKVDVKREVNYSAINYFWKWSLLLLKFLDQFINLDLLRKKEESKKRTFLRFFFFFFFTWELTIRFELREKFFHYELVIPFSIGSENDAELHEIKITICASILSCISRELTMSEEILYIL